MLFGNSLAFSMIQRMLAIWSLVPLPFLNPAWTLGSLWFMYCWSLAWRILSYFASLWDEYHCVVLWTFFGIAFLSDWNEHTFSSPVATAEFSKFALILTSLLTQMVKLMPAIAMREIRVWSLGQDDPLEKEMAVLLPGTSHGWRSLVVYSPWSRKESDRTEQFHFHFLSAAL